MTKAETNKVLALQEKIKILKQEKQELFTTIKKLMKSNKQLKRDVEIYNNEWEICAKQLTELEEIRHQAAKMLIDPKKIKRAIKKKLKEINPEDIIKSLFTY